LRGLEWKEGVGWREAGRCRAGVGRRWLRGEAKKRRTRAMGPRR